MLKKLCITMAATLAMTAASFAEENSKITIDGSTTVGPIVKALQEYYSSMNDIEINISESGSGNGAKQLMNRGADIGAMSRFMKPTEFKACVENGVMPVAHVVAIDGIAMVVHPSNPVKELTIEQIRAIYQGRHRSWRDFGGPHSRIVVVGRDTNSGTFETFEKLVMHKSRVARSVETVGSNGAVKSRVQSTPGAIGYVGLGFLDNSLKALVVNGVYPDKASVASGKYPIARPLFLFTDGYPKLGTPLHAFVTLYLTPKGQEIISKIGFIPVTSY